VDGPVIKDSGYARKSDIIVGYNNRARRYARLQRSGGIDPDHLLNIHFFQCRQVRPVVDVVRRNGLFQVNAVSRNEGERLRGTDDSTSEFVFHRYFFETFKDTLFMHRDGA